MTSREEIRTRIRGRQVPPGPPAYPKSGSVPKELSRAGVCQRPFAALQLIKDYDGTLYVSPCCLSWMEDQEFKPRVTDVSGIREFWSGPFMEDLRESVRSGSYKYCSQDRCPYLSSGNVAISLPSSVSAVPLVPAMLEYGAEVSCNLACPSCRNGPRFDNLKDPHIPISELLGMGITHFSANGSGEFFMSKNLLGFARVFTSSAFPNIRGIRLITNGTLLSEEMWRSLSEDFRKIVEGILVSIDSSSELVYGTVRKKAKYSDLMRNLQFLGEAHHNGEIPELEFSFTVSSDNIIDLPSFVSFSHDLGVKQLRIDNIQDWGHLGVRYREKAIHDPLHPNHSMYVSSVGDALEKAKVLGIKLVGSACSPA